MSVNQESSKLLVWADGSYCWADELEEYGQHKSDDYLTFVLPDYADERHADLIALGAQTQGYLSMEDVARILEDCK